MKKIQKYKFFTSKIDKIMGALIPTDTCPIDESYVYRNKTTNRLQILRVQHII